MKIPTLIASLASLFVFCQPANAFWRMSCSLIQTGRIDPVVNYGTVANHVHKIAGASSININSTYESLQASDCTSCSIQADKSAYWTPALYYQHANGVFEEVSNSGMTVYYLGRGQDAYGSKLAKPFPKGLKMLSGNNYARTQDLTIMTWGNKTYPPRLVSEAVSFVCINYANSTGQETHNITNLNCPQGFRAQIQMQSCWDGVNLYSSNQSHVAHLSQIDNGACPPTHPVLLPHLFYEVFYSITSFIGGDGNFVFANGDMTGYGFHGDFINGWDLPTLTDAIATCLIGNTAGAIENCDAFDASNVEDPGDICPEHTPVFPCEQVHGTLPQLPGCITGTGYGAIVTPANISCSGGNAVACPAVYNNTAPIPYAGDSTYGSLGCYTEGNTSRALKDKSYVSATNMTTAQCIAFCAGSIYVGVEWSQECYCGSTIQLGSVPANSSDCDMDCSGNRWEICGGSKRLNMFKNLNPPVTSTSISKSVTTSKSITTSKVVTSSAVATSSIIACPDSNGQNYTGASGKTYMIECATNHSGGDLSMVYLSSLLNCIIFCDATPGCVAWAFVSTESVGGSHPCYMKKSIGTAQVNVGNMGGTLVALPASKITTSLVATTSASF